MSVEAYGGILNAENAGPATLTNSEVQKNEAEVGPGGQVVGGIANLSPVAILLTNSTVKQNTPTDCNFVDPSCAIP